MTGPNTVANEYRRLNTLQEDLVDGIARSAAKLKTIQWIQGKTPSFLGFIRKALSSSEKRLAAQKKELTDTLKDTRAEMRVIEAMPEQTRELRLAQMANRYLPGLKDFSKRAGRTSSVLNMKTKSIPAATVPAWQRPSRFGRE